MAETILEKVMADLQNQIKNKKQELDNLGKEVNRLLDEKLALIQQINGLKDRCLELMKEQKKLNIETNELKDLIKKQKTDLEKEKIALSFAQEKFEAKEKLFETNKKKILDSFINKEKDIERDKKILQEKTRELNSAFAKYQDSQKLLDSELNKVELLAKDYQVKLKEFKDMQDELNTNIDRNKEIKVTLDNKILEIENLKKHQEALININQEKEKSLELQKIENDKKSHDLLEFKSQLDEKLVHISKAKKQLEEQEKQ